MPFGLGGGEIILIAIASITWIVPLVAMVWALITLGRLRRGQDELLARLAALERRLP